MQKCGKCEHMIGFMCTKKAGWRSYKQQSVWDEDLPVWELVRRDLGVDETPAAATARPAPLVPVGTLLYGEKGY